MKRLLILVFALTPLLVFSQFKKTDSIRVYFLGGQSNMDGHGFNKDLPDSLKSSFKNVWIFHGNPDLDGGKSGGLGIWEELKSGHGKGFTSDGKQNNLSNRFGIELSFAEKIQRLYPNQKIAIIKYAMGGTSIDSIAARQYGSWDPYFNGINQYDNFLTTARLALETFDIDKNGIEDKLIPRGIIWMQGESDALFEKSAINYYDNLEQLLILFRAVFRQNDLPIVIGKISDSGKGANGKALKYADLVQYAQEKIANEDRRTTIVRNTKYYEFLDAYHYTSLGYLDLGIKFAEAISRLNFNE